MHVGPRWPCEARPMEAFVTAGAGFLLAVLWFDLMHDVLVRGHDPDIDLPEPVLVAVATYYARVTTGARPMNRLVAAAMLATLLAIAVQLVAAVDGDTALIVPLVSLPLALAPIGVAGRRTVPTAVRLGARLDPADVQSRSARSIYAEHRFCFVCIALLLVVQLTSAAVG